MINFTPEDNAAVEWCEKNYPELTQEYFEGFVDGSKI